MSVIPQRIALTGATGAIGGAVLEELCAHYDPAQLTLLLRPSKKARTLQKHFPGVKVVYGSITDPQTLAHCFEGQDVVLHLAGVIPPHFDKNPEVGRRSNVEGTRCVTEALRSVAPNAFLLFASSVAVYGDRLKNPMIHIDDPVDETQEDGYALSKIAAEAIVRESGLDYSIFRLSAIMGLGNHKVSKILFHVPLETPMEIATVRDTARAFRLALNHREALKGQTFNLSGGEACRVLYKDFLSTLFRFYGLGKADFPAHSFATANFHCGFFHDADVLENILKFRRDTLDSYYTDFRNAVPGWMRISAACFRVPVKFFLGRLSEPRRALLQGDPAKIRLFFGDDPPALNE